MELNTTYKFVTTNDQKFSVSHPNKKDIHILRKVWHFVMGSLCASLYYFLTREQAITILAISGGVLIPFDIIRLYSPKLNKLILKSFGLIIRNEEHSRVSGMAYFVFAMFFVVVLFPKNIAMLGIYILAVGDPISSYFGLRFGKNKIIEGKSLEGSLACFVACSIITFIYLNVTHIMPANLIALSLIGGLAGSIAEMLPFNIDDNFIMPVFSSWIMWIAISLMSF